MCSTSQPTPYRGMRPSSIRIHIVPDRSPIKAQDTSGHGVMTLLDCVLIDVVLRRANPLLGLNVQCRQLHKHSSIGYTLYRTFLANADRFSLLNCRPDHQPTLLPATPVQRKAPCVHSSPPHSCSRATPSTCRHSRRLRSNLLRPTLDNGAFSNAGALGLRRNAPCCIAV